MRYLLLIFLTISLAACSSGGDSGPGISGKVTLGGAPQAGVTVTVTGPISASATTDSGGNYTIGGLKGGTYSVSPGKTGLQFAPVAMPAVVTGGSLTGYDFSASAALPVAAVQLPKTGQTIKYLTGDDGDLQKGAAWPDPRFTDNNDGTVTDKMTGLVWLKDASCIGKKGWLDALAASNSLASGLCGLNDNSKAGEWRMPNINELNSLVSVSRWNPAIGPMLMTGSSPDIPFKGVANYHYWSSTTSTAVTYQAWIVHFLLGQTNPSTKKSAFYAWPVRDASAPGTVRLPRTGQTFSYAVGDDGYHQKGAAWPTPRFTVNSNGTVTDNLTRLVWLKDANCLDEAGGQKRVIPRTPSLGATYSVLKYSKALTWVGGVASGICGLSDGSSSKEWRMPNRLEMQSLMDYSRSNPALPADHPFANVQSQGALTSTVMSYSTYGNGGDTSWFIYPESGIVNAVSNPNLTMYYLWAVRDGAQ